jgi:hypothetical protein
VREHHFQMFADASVEEPYLAVASIEFHSIGRTSARAYILHDSLPKIKLLQRFIYISKALNILLRLIDPNDLIG